MTQTQERPLLVIPASRRESPAVPVLIRVPMMAGSTRNPVIRLQPRRRRRLRREVRLVAMLLLCVLPISAGVYAFGGLRAVSSPTLVAALPNSGDEILSEPMLSIQHEPIVTLSAPTRENEVPVVLPGYLLPAESTEETSHGGH